MIVTEELLRALRARLPALELREREPMSAHTSFRIGGPVRAMALPSSTEEAAALLRTLGELGVRPLVMGNGTNLLVSDAPLDLFVVRMDEGVSRICREGETGLRAGAGAPLARVAQKAQSLGLTGLEFAAGIPGTVGGAVPMNAGAYGGEMKDVVTGAVYAGADGAVRELSAAELDFSYRRSAVSDAPGAVLEAVFVLAPGDPEDIQARMRELAEKRRASQPLDVPSAGSTFKRPAGGYAAALIDQAGLKGFAVGGAQVSPKHAGFVVNRGGATFDDVLRLMEHVQAEVYRKSGVLLEPEVKIIRG